MLLSKSNFYHIESRFEKKINDKRFLQYIFIDYSDVQNTMETSVCSLETTQFNNWWSEEYSVSTNKNAFSFISVNPFKAFYKQISIDTPRCFSKSHSLRRKTNVYNLSKLNGYFFTQGKSLTTHIKFVNALQSLYLKNSLNYIPTINSTSWLYLYTTLSSFNASNNLRQLPETPQSSHACNSYGFSYQQSHDYRSNLIANLASLEPMFIFYIYKVDKTIFKHSRGKSGKFTFIWKYVPSYKRRLIVMSWLKKEAKMQQSKTFSDRLLHVTSTICSNPNKTFMYRIRKFSYNYVYYNCRKTLAEHYRTVTK